MVSKKKVTISWSGGKDSAFALFKILLTGRYEVTGLHTVINTETKRVGMHGVREKLMEKQAAAIGLPLTKLYLESSETHAAYEKLMYTYYQQCADEGMEAVVFGDIFLEDLKEFRLGLLKSSGLEGIFPLWQCPTKTLIEDFIHAGFRTVICAANAQLFSEDAVGKVIDQKFLSSLKNEIDPCGENGEFHTFVFDGPLFKQPVDFLKGKRTKKVYGYQKVNESGETESVESAFWFQDLLSRMTL
jgi:uncharacterized protein (TIGR00290 family)